MSEPKSDRQDWFWIDDDRAIDLNRVSSIRRDPDSDLVYLIVEGIERAMDGQHWDALKSALQRRHRQPDSEATYREVFLRVYCALLAASPPLGNVGLDELSQQDLLHADPDVRQAAEDAIEAEKEAKQQAERLMREAEIHARTICDRLPFHLPNRLS